MIQVFIYVNPFFPPSLIVPYPSPISPKPASPFTDIRSESLRLLELRTDLVSTKSTSRTPIGNLKEHVGVGGSGGRGRGAVGGGILCIGEEEGGRV